MPSQQMIEFDWPSIHAQLWEQGWARVVGLLSEGHCRELSALYAEEDNFRSRIIMARHRFGRGEYKYFKYPLPSLVESLRRQAYAGLAPLANQWSTRCRSAQNIPPTTQDL